MVYMKGVPESPQCGFSAMVVRILNEYGKYFNFIFGSVDLLELIMSLWFSLSSRFRAGAS